MYGLEIGGANINCNYLSPLPYAGSGVGVYGAWGKRMKQHKKTVDAVAATLILEGYLTFRRRGG